LAQEFACALGRPPTHRPPPFEQSSTRMGKRAGSPKASPSAKAAKLQAEKEAAALEAARAAFGEECDSVVAFLMEAESKGNLSTPCREMLQVATPLALHTPQEERHPYQASIVETIAGLFSSAEVEANEAVAAAEAEVAKHADSKSVVDASLQGAEAVAATKTEAKTAKSAAFTAAGKAVEAAKTALKEEQAKAEAIAQALQTIQADKEEYEKAMEELWAPLKACSFAGKDWRKRDKAIAQMMDLFKKLDIEQSLAESIPIAFKTKVEARGAFAGIALDAGEARVQAYFQGLDEKKVQSEGEAAEQTKAIASAEATVAAATDAYNTAMEESIVAENEGLDADSKVTELKGEIEEFGPKSAELAAALDAAKGSLGSCLKLLAKFQALKARSNAPAEEPASAAAEEPPAAAAEEPAAAAAEAEPMITA